MDTRLQQLGDLSVAFPEQDGGGRKRKRGADDAEEDADEAQGAKAADGDSESDGDIVTHATACMQKFQIALPAGVTAGQSFSITIPSYGCQVTLPFPRDKVAGQGFVFQARPPPLPVASHY